MLTPVRAVLAVVAGAEVGVTPSRQLPEVVEDGIGWRGRNGGGPRWAAAVMMG